MSEKKGRLATYIDGLTQRNMRSTTERLMDVEAPAQSNGPPEPPVEPQQKQQQRPLDAIDYDNMQGIIEEFGGSVSGDISKTTVIGDTRAEVVGGGGALEKYSALQQRQEQIEEAERKLPRKGSEVAAELLNKNSISTKTTDAKSDITDAAPTETKALSAFERKQFLKKQQNIRNDMKRLQWKGTQDEREALISMQSVGVSAFDILSARSEWDRNGKGGDWTLLSPKEKVGYAHLHKAEAILDGNKSETYGLRERTIKTKDGKKATERYYTKKGAEVNKVRLLRDLVDRGVISAEELVDDGEETVSRLVSDSTRGDKGTRLDVSALDKIIYRKETDLAQAKQEAEKAGAETLVQEAEVEQERLTATKKYWKQRKSDDTTYNQLSSQVVDTFTNKTKADLLQDWYDMGAPLRSTSASLADERRKEIMKERQKLLSSKGISSKEAQVFLKYQKGGIHAKTIGS